jgi:hypothetical protein
MLLRWALEIQKYDFVIRHRPGRLPENVEAISRATLEANHLDLDESSEIREKRLSKFCISVPKVYRAKTLFGGQKDAEIRIRQQVQRGFDASKRFSSGIFVHLDDDFEALRHCIQHCDPGDPDQELPFVEAIAVAAICFNLNIYIMQSGGFVHVSGGKSCGERLWES